MSDSTQGGLSRIYGNPIRDALDSVSPPQPNNDAARFSRLFNDVFDDIFDKHHKEPPMALVNDRDGPQDNVPASEIPESYETPTTDHPLTGPHMSEDDQGDADALAHSNQQQVALRTSVEWLTALKRRVGKQGVSQEDINAIDEIRERVATISGESFPTVAALEHYPQGSFTGKPSQLNLEVATEALDQTIVATIKRWIKKFIEYLQKFMVWWRKTFNNEEFYNDIMMVLSGRVAESQRKVMELRNQYVRSAVTVDEEIRQRQQTLFAQMELANNDMARAALFDVKLIQQIDTQERKLESVTTTLSRGSEQLANFLKGTEDELDLTDVDTAQTLLGMIKMEFEKLSTVRPGKEEIPVLDIMNQLHRSLPANSDKAVPFQYLYLTATYINDRLKAISKIDIDPESVESTSYYLSGLSRSMENIGQLAQVIQSYNSQRAMVMKTMVSALFREIEELVKLGNKQAVNEHARSRIKKLGEDFKATIARRYAMPRG